MFFLLPAKEVKRCPLHDNPVNTFRRREGRLLLQDIAIFSVYDLLPAGNDIRIGDGLLEGDSFPDRTVLDIGCAMFMAVAVSPSAPFP